MSSKRVTTIGVLGSICALLVASCGGGAEPVASSTTASEGSSEIPMPEPATTGPTSKGLEIGGGILYRYSSPVAEAPAEPTKIWFLGAQEADPAAQSARDIIESDLTALGNVTFEYQTAGGYDKPHVQMDQLDRAISDSATRGIILWSVDATLTKPVVEQACDSGIVFVTFIEAINDVPCVVNQLTFDSTQFADDIMTGVIENAGGSGKFAAVLGLAGSSTHVNFIAGAERAVARFPDAELVSVKEWSGVDPGTAQTLTEEVLTLHPDLKGVLTILSLMGQGIANAVDGAGLSGQVVIGALQLSGPADIELVSSGKLGVLLGIPFAVWAHSAAYYIATGVDGEPLEPWVTPPGSLYTPDNILLADFTSDLLPDYLGEYADCPCG